MWPNFWYQNYHSGFTLFSLTATLSYPTFMVPGKVETSERQFKWSSACVYKHTFITVSGTNHVRINDFKKQIASQNHWQAVTSGPYHGSNSTLLPITWQCIFYSVRELVVDHTQTPMTVTESGTVWLTVMTFNRRHLVFCKWNNKDNAVTTNVSTIKAIFFYTKKYYVFWPMIILNIYHHPFKHLHSIIPTGQNM